MWIICIYLSHDETPNPVEKELAYGRIIAAVILPVVVCMICG
jgi:hypothetical protein